MALSLSLSLSRQVVKDGAAALLVPIPLSEVREAAPATSQKRKVCGLRSSKSSSVGSGSQVLGGSSKLAMFRYQRNSTFP